MSDIPGTSAAVDKQWNFINRGGGQVLLHAGHQYYKKKTLKNRVTVYECYQRRQKCRGSVKILNNAVIMENPHSHAPDFAKNILDQKLHEVKQDISATEASKSVPRIYKEAIGSMKDDGLDLIKKIPNFKNIKSTLYKKRNDAVQMQKIFFNDLNEVTVPPKFIPFVLADYSHQDYRIIFFSAGDMRHLMSTLKDFLGDGTFKSCPKPFLQLYIVHADFGSQNVTTNIVPVVYALMSHKDQKVMKFYLTCSNHKFQIGNLKLINLIMKLQQ